MGSACCVQSITLFDGSPMGGSKSDNSKTRGPGGPAVATRNRAGATEHEPSPSALDRWLNERLRVLYGPVLSEPIPDDLAQLIELHRRNKQHP